MLRIYVQVFVCLFVCCWCQISFFRGESSKLFKFYYFYCFSPVSQKNKLMAYFAVHDQPAQWRGKPHGRVAIPELPSHRHADEIKEEQINKMFNAAKGNDIFTKMDNSPAPRGGKQIDASHQRTSNIFGPPIELPKPQRRIRVGVSDEELRKIWAHDDHKEQVAKAMATKTNMMHKMDNNRGNAFPFAIKEPLQAHKRNCDLPGGRSDGSNFEVAGFKGLGAYSKPDLPRGRFHSAPTAGRQVEAPTLMPRIACGKRMVPQTNQMQLL